MIRLPTAARIVALAAGVAALPTAPAAEPPRPNRLGAEASPYLRLHADNPVDWYPWGDEALQRARREDRPIFLSVGYSTCYWCHVMEREVFSDPGIAAQMNRGFVNVKVDREERPEIDEIYMTATRLLTGHGGWPNSVFLTPDLEPFFAGTYFPPRDRPGLPGFPTVLSALEIAWIERRDEVERRAGEIAAAVRGVLAASPAGGEPPSVEDAAEAARRLQAEYDDQHGGFGGAPKFPSPGNLWLLWERGSRGDAASRRMVVATLTAMGRGAIHDRLGGGFHRYTVDAAWRIPHFEKMLYDNALLAELLVTVAVETADGELERLARGTADFLLTEMALPEGVFKSAIDAETDGVEGAYYTWSSDELAVALTPTELALLAPIFGFDGEPDLEGDRHTLYLTAPLADHARRLGIPPAELERRLEPPLAKLRAARSRRPPPRVDDKVLTDWNGMAVAALALAGARLDEPRYLRAAERAAEFLLGLRDTDGVLLHVWRGGEARIRAFLDDYAFLVRGLLALDASGAGERWRFEAERLTAELERRLGQPGGGYFTSEARGDLLLRAATAVDGAIPSGNGVAALNLLQLADRTGKPAYRRRAGEVIGAFGGQLRSYPSAVATLARASARYHRGDGAAPGAPVGLVEAMARYTAAAGGDGWRPFELRLAIRPGWHINANPASLEFLVPTRLEGDVRGVEYPAPTAYAPAFVDEPIRVYSGSVAVAGEARPGGGVTLTYQPCDDRRCLPPTTVTVDIRQPEGP